MANESAAMPKTPRGLSRTTICPSARMGTWFAETIKASGLMSRANRPNTRPHLTKCRSPQKSLALQAPSTQDKPAVGVMRKLGAFGPEQSWPNTVPRGCSIKARFQFAGFASKASNVIKKVFFELPRPQTPRITAINARAPRTATSASTILVPDTGISG